MVYCGFITGVVWCYLGLWSSGLNCGLTLLPALRSWARMTVEWMASMQMLQLEGRYSYKVSIRPRAPSDLRVNPTFIVYLSVFSYGESSFLYNDILKAHNELPDANFLGFKECLCRTRKRSYHKDGVMCTLIRPGDRHLQSSQGISASGLFPICCKPETWSAKCWDCCSIRSWKHLLGVQWWPDESGMHVKGPERSFTVYGVKNVYFRSRNCIDLDKYITIHDPQKYWEHFWAQIKLFIARNELYAEDIHQSQYLPHKKLAGVQYCLVWRIRCIRSRDILCGFVQFVFHEWRMRTAVDTRYFQKIWAHHRSQFYHFCHLCLYFTTCGWMAIDWILGSLGRKSKHALLGLYICFLWVVC